MVLWQPKIGFDYKVKACVNLPVTDGDVISEAAVRMSVVYKSAGKIKQLRGTRVGALYNKVALFGVVYATVAGGLLLLALPRQHIKASHKPLTINSRITKSFEEALQYNPSKDARSI